MKKIVIVALIIVGSLPVFAQRPIVNTPPPEPKLSAVESNDPLVSFSKKGLPNAYIVGENRSDGLAARLAK